MLRCYPPALGIAGWRPAGISSWSGRTRRDRSGISAGWRRIPRRWQGWPRCRFRQATRCGVRKARCSGFGVGKNGCRSLPSAVSWTYRRLTVDVAPTFARCFLHDDLLGNKKGRYFQGSGPKNAHRRRNAAERQDCRWEGDLDESSAGPAPVRYAATKSTWSCGCWYWRDPMTGAATCKQCNREPWIILRDLWAQRRSLLSWKPLYRAAVECAGQR